MIRTAVVTLDDGREAEVDVEVPDSFEAPGVSGNPPLNPEQSGPPDAVRRALSILPVAGGVVGGIAGGPGGALLGGAGGEAYRQLGSRKFGLDSPGTSAEAAKRIGIEGVTQGAGEFAGAKILTPILKAAGRVSKKPLGDMFQLITKMKPEDAATLFKNPKAIFPWQWTKAQKAWKSAAEKIGLPVDDVSPEMIQMLKGDSKKMVFETYERMAAGEAVSAKEAQIAKQAIDIAVMPVAKTVRKNPLVATLEKIRHKFVERIGQESPEMAAANKQYGIAATGKKFRSVFPRNTTGDPAWVRSSLMPSLLAGAGISRGETGEGVLQGAALAGLTSPLAIGSVISGAGAGRALVPYVGRAGTAVGADLLKKYLERE